MRGLWLATGLIAAAFFAAVPRQVLAQQPPAQSNAQEPAPPTQTPAEKPGKTSKPTNKAKKTKKTNTADKAGAGFSSPSPASASQTPSGTASPPPPTVPVPDASKEPAASPKSQKSAAEQNPFPEDVSRQAAKNAEGTPANLAPPSPQPPAGKRSTADENPFPEAVSQKAAQAGGVSDSSPPAENQPASKAPLPSSVSSSQSSSLGEAGEGVKPGQGIDATRAKKDTQVGDFYFAQGDWQGAYDRYKDANTYDSTNVDAIFGLAEADRKLGRDSEAKSYYALYLAIVPDGPKAKQSRKALKSIEEKK